MASAAPDPVSGGASNGPFMVATSIAFLVLAWIAVSLRFCVRHIMLRSLGFDDWIMGLALIIFTLFCAFIIVLVAHGGGAQDATTLGLNALRENLRYTITTETLYIACMTVFKISLGAFLLRIVVLPWHTVFIYVVMAISTSYGVAYFFFALFQCGEPTKILENKLAGHCQSAQVQLGMGYTHAAVQALTDWAFAVLPILIMWNAKMDRQSKVSVAFILMLGAAGSTATLVRFKYVPGLVDDADFFFAASKITITCTIEAGLGITAASLATLRPLFVCCFRRVRGTIPSSERRAIIGNPRAHYSRSNNRIPGNVVEKDDTFRSYNWTSAIDNVEDGVARTVIAGNHRSSSSADEISLEDQVPRDRSFEDPMSSKSIPDRRKDPGYDVSTHLSWFKIEKTTTVDVSSEI